MKKILKLSIILIMMLFMVLTHQFVYENNSIAATTQKQLIEDGVYTIKSALNEKFVLDIYENLSTNGANVELWTNNQENNQKFTIKYLSDGTYSITAVNSKKSLDVEGNLKKAGTNVLQWTSNSQDNQKWLIKSAGNGYYKIVSKSCNLCLDVPYSKAQNGSNIQVWTDNGGKNQMFKFEKETSNNNTQTTIPKGIKTIENGTYIIKSAINNNFVFDIYDNSTKDGANLELWTNTGNTNQRFTVKYLNDGTYSITAVNSKKNIDVEGNLKKAGTNVLQWTANNQDNQKWIIKDAGSGNYNIISNSCGLYLDIPYSNAKSGANVQVWTGNGGKNQMFKFEKYVAPTTSDVVSDGIYTVRSAASNDNVWDIADSSMIDGGNLLIWGNGSRVNQKFSLKRLSSGYYTISAIHSGKYIDVEGASKKNGTNVLQWSYNGADNQLWTIKSTGDGYYNVISKCSGLYITIYSGNICVKKSDGSNNQKFKFDNSNTVPSINTTKYPGYKEKVQALIKKHPNWHFEFLYTGLKFDDVVKGECALHSRNLVPTSYNGEWVCSTCGTKLYDSGWYCASEKAVAYYMDPRNFLDEINVFQYQNVNQYVEDTCPLDGIRQEVNGTFLQNYANDIYTACRNKKVNAYYIISRLIQEQGRNGTTIGKGMDGGDGKTYYNPFNIGASGNGYSQIYSNALATAKSYNWNTMEKALEGGIDFCKRSWLDNYQNTLYQNKFDIDTRNGTSLYAHQYMQNLMGAYSEARLLYGMYNDTSKTNEYFTFIIPVYEGMSSTTAQAPKNATSGNTATVKTKDGIGCKVRSAPGTSSTVITAIADGVQVKIIEKGKYNNIDGYNWCKVQIPDGRQGYMPDKFLV